jgi:hypothetical protein
MWLDGGSYFGVPVSNFMGWVLTTFVFLQVFALYLRGQQNFLPTDEQPSRIQRLQPILFYGLIAAGYVLNNLTRARSGTVTDPAGVVWRVQNMYAVTGLVAIFTMGAFTILGVVKVMESSPAVQNAPREAVLSSSPERQVLALHTTSQHNEAGFASQDEELARPSPVERSST